MGKRFRGNWRPGDWKQGIGGWRWRLALEFGGNWTGDWRLETGDWKLGTGSWKLGVCLGCRLLFYNQCFDKQLANSALEQCRRADRQYGPSALEGRVQEVRRQPHPAISGWESSSRPTANMAGWAPDGGSARCGNRRGSPRSERPS